MDIINLIIILAILCLVIAVIVYYIKALKKPTDDIEYESVYSLDYLVQSVAKEFADILKTNLSEQNLSKRELESAKRKKLESISQLKKFCGTVSTVPQISKFIYRMICCRISGPAF